MSPKILAVVLSLAVLLFALVLYYSGGHPAKIEVVKIGVEQNGKTPVSIHVSLGNYRSFTVSTLVNGKESLSHKSTRPDNATLTVVTGPDLSSGISQPPLIMHALSEGDTFSIKEGEERVRLFECVDAAETHWEHFVSFQR